MPMTFDALSNYIEFHRAGGLRILAVSGAERGPQLPGVPNFAEQGLAVVDKSSWFGVFAPGEDPDGAGRPTVGRAGTRTAGRYRS